MKRIWGHVLTTGAIAACAVALSPACVHNDSSVFIAAVLFPPQSTGTSGCIYTSDPTQPILSQGTLDVGLSDEYLAPMLIGNQIATQTSQTLQRTETSRVEIQGAIVRITDAVGNQLASYTTLTSTTVGPGSGTQPGYEPIFVTVLDPATATSLGGSLAPGASHRVITYTRVFGQTLGGEHVESNEFEYPITVCYGCLVQFPPANVNPLDPQPNCNGAGAAGGGAASAAPCFFGQDQPVDCSLCAYSNPAVCNPGGAITPPTVDAGTSG